jgi:hypothetical protein
MCCAPRQWLPRSREAWWVAMERQCPDAARRDEKRAGAEAMPLAKCRPESDMGFPPCRAFGANGSAALARLFSIRVISGLVSAHAEQPTVSRRRKPPSNTLFMPN